MFSENMMIIFSVLELGTINLQKRVFSDDDDDDDDDCQFWRELGSQLICQSCFLRC
jgi:hypothetical protein